jgi:hypothetical protein
VTWAHAHVQQLADRGGAESVRNGTASGTREGDRRLAASGRRFTTVPSISVATDVYVAIASAVIVGAIGWLARPIFGRPQQALTRAFSGPPFASDVQVRVDQMSDVPVLEGPTSYVFATIDPRQVQAHAMPRGVTQSQTWAYDHGGEDVAISILQVTPQGLTSDPISIGAPVLRPQYVLARRSAERFGPGGLGCGGVMPRHYTFRLRGNRVEREF